MLENESLKPAEAFVPGTEEMRSDAGAITKAEVETIYRDRKKLLDEIKPAVCLKFYNDTSEKLENEKRQFEQLLNRQNARDEALSHYSFVLNPHYFEQKFLITAV